LYTVFGCSDVLEREPNAEKILGEWGGRRFLCVRRFHKQQAETFSLSQNATS
jgi:hypothetical protein